MGILQRIELVENVISIAQGHIPISLGFKVLPIFFPRKKGLTKAQRKKLMMRRRRMFVDNIIMHHKRLHDKNREQIIDETKAKLTKKAPQKAPAERPGSSIQLGKPNQDFKWREKAKPARENFRTNREKIQVKGAVDIDREKSRSKWATRVVGGNTREI